MSGHVICDKCKKLKDLPFNGIFQCYASPDKWERINEKDLCDKCVSEYKKNFKTFIGA